MTTMSPDERMEFARERLDSWLRDVSDNSDDIATLWGQLDEAVAKYHKYRPRGNTNNNHHWNEVRHLIAALQLRSERR